MGGLMIKSCQGGGGVSQMIIAFSSNMNTVNLHLNIKPWSCYKIMKGFLLKANSLDISKVVSRSVSLILTLTWDTDILIEKLRPETGGWISKILFALCLPDRRFHAKSVFILISLVVIARWCLDYRTF